LLASNLHLQLASAISGGAMLKALFVMIVLSNDYAARLVHRLHRSPG
jgi:hypothetical protein